MANSKIDQAGLENIYVYMHTDIFFFLFVLKTKFLFLHKNFQINSAKTKIFANFSLMAFKSLKLYSKMQN